MGNFISNLGDMIPPSVFDFVDVVSLTIMLLIED